MNFLVYGLSSPIESYRLSAVPCPRVCVCVSAPPPPHNVCASASLSLVGICSVVCRVCVCTCGGQRSMLSIFLNPFPPYCLSTRDSPCTWSSAVLLDWLATHCQEVSHLTFLSAGITDMCCSVQLLHGCWAPKLTSSCFRNKRLTDRAISPAFFLLSFFLRQGSPRVAQTGPERSAYASPTQMRWSNRPIPRHLASMPTFGSRLLEQRLAHSWY